MHRTWAVPYETNPPTFSIFGMGSVRLHDVQVPISKMFNIKNS